MLLEICKALAIALEISLAIFSLAILLEMFLETIAVGDLVGDVLRNWRSCFETYEGTHIRS